MILRPFFIVEEHFEIAGRGTVLLPVCCRTLTGTASIGDDILIREADGQELETNISGIGLIAPNPKLIAPVLIQGLRKSDVPIGSELFLLDTESADD